MLKTSGIGGWGLLFSLFNYFCNLETFAFKTGGRLLFSLLIINKYYTPKMLLQRIL